MVVRKIFAVAVMTAGVLLIGSVSIVDYGIAAAVATVGVGVVAVLAGVRIFD